MPGMDVLEPIPKRDMHIFYVLDTSGSMSGEKIGKLNSAMKETTQALSELAKKNADANLKIAVMSFDSNCHWQTVNGPENLAGDFIYQPLKTGGLTEMGKALKELNTKLNRKGWLQSMTGALMPVIIFMTDGYPTDSYMGELEKIRKNRWFHRATKIGFAIGDADLSMIASVVGNSEAVIQTTDLEVFKKLIRFVSVTASMLNSQSSTEKTAPTGASVVELAKKTLDNPNSVSVKIPDSSYSKEPPPKDNDDWDDDDW